MTQLQKIADVKPFQKPKDSIFSTLINRKISRVLTFFMVKHIPWLTPTQVNILSLIFSLMGCALFVHPNYWWRLVGILVLQLGFTLDCCDGEVARIKNAANQFGAWLDSVLDRFKEFAMLAALTAQWYIFVNHSPKVLMVGGLAIIGLQLVSYLREAKKSSWPSTRVAELFITKNIYLGTVDITIYLVCFGVMIHQEYLVLWMFLIISLPLIIKQILSAAKMRNQSSL